jgi:hypothetical protein
MTPKVNNRGKIPMKKLFVASLLALGLAIPQAEAAEGVKIGVLTCHVEGGVGLILGSSKAMDCIFAPAGGGPTEEYEGRISKIGIDVGVTGDTTLAWAVFAPGKVKAGALEGSYGGASAEATVIAGLGANVLIGGLKRSINLQPLSVQAQTGLNIAAGIAGMRLDYVGT